MKQNTIDRLPLGITANVVFEAKKENGERLWSGVFLDELAFEFDSASLEATTLHSCYFDPKDDKRPVSFLAVYSIKAKKAGDVNVTLRYSDFFSENYVISVVDKTPNLSLFVSDLDAKYYDSSSSTYSVDDTFTEQADSIEEYSSIQQKWHLSGEPKIAQEFFEKNYLIVAFLYKSDTKTILDGVFNYQERLCMTFIQKRPLNDFYSSSFQVRELHRGVVYLGLQKDRNYQSIQTYYVLQPISQD